MRLSLILFFFINFISPATSANIVNTLDGLIDQQFPHATVAVVVKDSVTNKLIYSRNADKLLAPASGSKLFTAAAALYYLKPDYSYITSLTQKNDDFYLTFSGSPSLTTEHLYDLISHLKNEQYPTVANIIIDTSQFKPPYYSGAESYDDLGWYFAAPTTAVILNGNQVSYEFISPKLLGSPIEIKAKTPPSGINIINQVIAVDKKKQKDHCNLNLDILSDNTLRLFGCIATSKEPKLMQLAITDPVLLAKQIIQNALERHAIKITGVIKQGVTPADVIPVAVTKSKKLDELITHMLRESDNLYANSLYKHLGYTLTGEGTFKQGAFAMKQILTKNTHLDMKQIELDDGAGGRYNLVTAEQIVILLTDLYSHPNLKSLFINALPQSGVSGTLKDRMKKSILEHIIYAKTGSMHDVSSLSGYMIRPNKHPLIFSIIINGINKPLNEAKDLEDKILMVVAKE